MLHEGLGCVGLWGDFPDRLAAATGAGVFVYSRAGYGASTPVALPRPLDYMHVEALEVLPKLLDAIGFRRGLLVGHSDGASIAAIYAGGVQDHRVRGRRDDRAAFHRRRHLGGVDRRDQEGLRDRPTCKAKLARWHKDVDNAFYGWNDAWLDPKFRNWDISEYLAYIRVPVAILQGADDQYGTMRQIEIAQEECYCPVDVTDHARAPDIRRIARRRTRRSIRSPTLPTHFVHELAGRARNAAAMVACRAVDGCPPRDKRAAYAAYRKLDHNCIIVHVGSSPMAGWPWRENPLAQRRGAHRFSDRSVALPALEARRRRRRRDADAGCRRERRAVRGLSAQAEFLRPRRRHRARRRGAAAALRASRR